MQIAENVNKKTLYVKEYFTKLKCKESKQVFSLYLSMIIVMILGFLISIVNTRLLGPQFYGDLKFIISIVTFVSGILAFGFVISCGRLIALRENYNIRNKLIGTAFSITTFLSFLLVICIFISSFFIDDYFHTDVSRTIRIFSPFLFVFPFTACIENLMQGDNQIYRLALFRFAPQILYLIGALSFNHFIPLSLTASLGIQLGFLGLVNIGFVFILKPNFRLIWSTMPVLFQENRRYGFHVYLGSLAGATTASLLSICLGYFADTTAVGFYSLALTIATPLMFIPNVIGITLFNRFANSNFIPKEVVLVAVFLTILIALPYFLLIDKFIIFVYSNDYSPTIKLVYFTALGCIFHGFGELYNRFLSAQGKGKELRNGAYLVGVSIVLGGLLLLPCLGALGAAITRLTTGVAYLCVMIYYYKFNFSNVS